MSGEQDMRSTCQAITDDLAAIKRYVEIEKEGDMDFLYAVIQNAFGHKEDTTLSRIRSLTKASVIIVNGKRWRYNPNADKHLNEKLVLMNKIRSNPIESGELTEEQKDEANRLKYRAPQE